MSKGQGWAIVSFKVEKVEPIPMFSQSWGSGVGGMATSVTFLAVLQPPGGMTRAIPKITLIPLIINDSRLICG